jgi:pimeloyl-ACP methyl ester carboxylesterase
MSKTTAQTVPVLALPCSGVSGQQWSNKLGPALGNRFQLIAPDLIGTGGNPHWTGDHRFQLADEAAAIVDIIDALDGAVHLVGHSYGGGVALRVARERPTRVASLTLYEPAAFHVLRCMGPDGNSALEEIRAVAEGVTRDVVAGSYRTAARCFVEYWNGAGAWAALKPAVQTELVRYVPKAVLEFGALIDEPTPLVAYRRFCFPIRLLRGEHAPMPTALIAHKLFSIVRAATIEQIPDAGHMGPFTHADVVSEMIAAHVAEAAGIDRATKTVGRLPAAA